jgi:hypothetical protein
MEKIENESTTLDCLVPHFENLNKLWVSEENSG